MGGWISTFLGNLDWTLLGNEYPLYLVDGTIRLLRQLLIAPVSDVGGACGMLVITGDKLIAWGDKFQLSWGTWIGLSWGSFELYR